MAVSGFEIARYLSNEEAMQWYLADCLEEGGESLWLKAKAEVDRARRIQACAHRPPGLESVPI